MNILIIGASGFLGNVLCRALLKMNHSITGADLNATTAQSLSNLNIKKVDLDIRDSKKLAQIIPGQDIIYHLASIIRITKDIDQSMYQINVEGVSHVANAALKSNIKKFIYVSSIHAFNRYPANEIIDENRQLALSPHEFDYDKSKALGEIALMEVINKGLKAIIISPTCFIGPYDYQPSLMGAAISNFFSQKIIPYIAGGFNFLDVRDVADTLIQAITKGVSGERYILGGQWLSIDQMIDLIIEVRKSGGIKVKIPSFIAQFSAQLNLLKWRLIRTEPPYSNQSLSHLKFHQLIDDSKAKKILNHNPRPLTETLHDLFDWYTNKRN